MPDAVNKRLRIKARVKSDAGLGLWPAFWALPEDFSTNFAYCSGCGSYGEGRGGGALGAARSQARPAGGAGAVVPRSAGAPGGILLTQPSPACPLSYTQAAGPRRASWTSWNSATTWQQ